MTNLAQATAQALAAPVAEAQPYAQTPPVAPLDETGWRAGHTRAWLWGAVTAWGTVCVVRRSRGAQVAQALLGERCWGTLVTDRWSASPWSPTRWRQVCWAHLLRDFEAMMERGGRSQALGEGLREQARPRLHAWHGVRDGTRTHAPCRVAMRPLRRAVARGLNAGHICGVAKTAGVCREVRKVYDARWTFVRVEGVEPTKNAAERAIRPGVLWRNRQLWHAECPGGPVCRGHADGGGHAQTTASTCPCVYDRHMPGRVHGDACPFAPPSSHRG